MSNTNGVAYRDKSMNGVITISDGAGTTIENGTITTNTLSIGTLTTNIIKSTTSASTVSLYTQTDGAINIGNGLATTLKLVGNFIFSVLSLTTTAVSDTVNLFSNLTTGRVNIGTAITTGRIDIGGIAMTSSGTINIGGSQGNITSIGAVRFASTGSPQLVGISTPSTAFIAQIFTNITTGTIQLGTSLTTALQLGGTSGIQLNGNIRQNYTTLITPTSTQLGYTYPSTLFGTAVGTGWTRIRDFGTGLPVGVWLVVGGFGCNSGGDFIGISLSFTTALDATYQSIFGQSSFNIPTIQLTRIVTVLSGVQPVYMLGSNNIVRTASSPYLTATRLA